MSYSKEVVDHYETNHADTKNHKILFCAQGTKAINDLIRGGLQQWATSKGYKVVVALATLKTIGRSQPHSVQNTMESRLVSL